jgi:hypothetical protein
MPEAVRVASVLVGVEPQIQGVLDTHLVDRTFQEPAELLNFQIGHLIPKTQYRRTVSATGARAGVSVPTPVGFATCWYFSVGSNTNTSTASNDPRTRSGRQRDRRDLPLFDHTPKILQLRTTGQFHQQHRLSWYSGQLGTIVLRAGELAQMSLVNDRDSNS